VAGRIEEHPNILLRLDRGDGGSQSDRLGDRGLRCPRNRANCDPEAGTRRRMPDMNGEEAGDPAGAAGAPTRLADPSRVLAFSDAVFAIIVTLLVLDLQPPHTRPSGLLTALLHKWPSYVAFTISFVYIGVIWLNHHALFRLIGRVNAPLNWLNLWLLFGAVLIPFPTATLAAAFAGGDRHDERAAVALYAAAAGLMSVPWLFIFRYLLRHAELRAPGISDRYLRAQLPRPLTGIVLYGLSGVVGWFVDPVVGVVVFVVMIVYHGVTSEGLRRLSRRPG
jgi:uncharacterized membrane protein